MFLNRKDFLGLRDLTAEELDYVLKTASTGEVSCPTVL